MMTEYEKTLRKHTSEMTKEKALEYLEGIEFATCMIDRWSHEDYEQIDIVRKLIKEYKDEKFRDS